MGSKTIFFSYFAYDEKERKEIALPHLHRAVDNLKLQFGDIQMMTDRPVYKDRGWIDNSHRHVQINLLGERLGPRALENLLQQVGRK